LSVRGKRSLRRPNPVDVNATKGRVSQGVKRLGRKVEVSDRTACAPVSDRDFDALALVASSDLLVANWVVVGVQPTITGVGVEKEVRDGSNVLGVSIGDTTCAEASLIICALTILSADHEAWLTSVARG
jgi:hypothetical protein